MKDLSSIDWTQAVLRCVDRRHGDVRKACVGDVCLMVDAWNTPCGEKLAEADLASLLARVKGRETSNLTREGKIALVLIAGIILLTILDAIF